MADVLLARTNLAVSLARELKGSGITSNTVALRAMLVDSVKNLILGMAEQIKWGDTWEEIEKMPPPCFYRMTLDGLADRKR